MLEIYNNLSYDFYQMKKKIPRYTVNSTYTNIKPISIEEKKH